MALTRKVLDKTLRECMDLRILLAGKYPYGTFRVMYHPSIPKEENVKIAKKRRGDVNRLSINYDSNHIEHRDLLNYLSENGYSHFEPSVSSDEIDTNYDSRVVGYLHPEINHFSKFV
jgi:signal peptidase I